MSLYCLPTEPYIDKQFPDNRKWVIVTKDYPKPTPETGKKKVTKEKTQQYNDMMAKREKMFKQLETGHYDCFNQATQGEDILNYASWILGGKTHICYRVKPTSCKVVSERYGSSNTYPISEFDVVNKCDTTEKLLLQLDSDDILNDFLANTFDSGRYKNRQDEFREMLKFCKSNIKEYNFCVGNVVVKDTRFYNSVPRFKNDEGYVQDYAKELIKDGLLLLHAWADFFEKRTFTFLLRMNWFDIALDYIKDFDKFSRLREEIINDKEFKDIERILKTNNDKESVKEIIKLLDFKPSILTLKAFPYVSKWDDDFEESDEPEVVKEFENVDDIRAYLISEYKIPFSKLTSDISDFEYSTEERERTHFIVE